MASSQPNRLFIVSDSSASPYGTCSSELIAIVSAKSREDVINYLTVKYKKYIPVDKLRQYCLRRYDKKSIDTPLFNSLNQLYEDFGACALDTGKKFIFLVEGYIHNTFHIVDQGEMEVIKL